MLPRQRREEGEKELVNNQATTACLFVNEYCTDLFPTPSSVKQGDTLTPTVFAMFINALAK